MFKAVVFDMDGVILDSEKVYRMCEYQQIKELGLDTSRVNEFCEKIAGGTDEVNQKYFYEIFKPDIDYISYRKLFQAKCFNYRDTHGFDLKPGVLELLQFLKDNGIKIAMATSTSESSARKAFGPHGIEKYFDYFVFGDMIPEGHGKPEPDIYLKACEGVGVDPKEAIGVEDSINGVTSSHRAGLYTVMVVDLIEPDERVNGKADRIFRKIIDIEDIIKEENK
ncbi:MAG: HAD family phosphatase [Lachnospiraceae bacterium]|jgi:HAD superfamily hydrolase (TIGR01509 family)|nr:HAD family phosphatase [Lachnospiraceae bacterium]MEE3461252.1 HAD family phosphatase [Lachnospiraceae bacterium]